MSHLSLKCCQAHKAKLQYKLHGVHYLRANNHSYIRDIYALFSPVQTILKSASSRLLMKPQSIVATTTKIDNSVSSFPTPPKLCTLQKQSRRASDFKEKMMMHAKFQGRNLIAHSFVHFHTQMGFYDCSVYLISITQFPLEIQDKSPKQTLVIMRLS